MSDQLDKLKAEVYDLKEENTNLQNILSSVCGLLSDRDGVEFNTVSDVIKHLSPEIVEDKE